jgi:hypothetical protein
MSSLAPEKAIPFGRVVVSGLIINRIAGAALQLQGHAKLRPPAMRPVDTATTQLALDVEAAESGARLEGGCFRGGFP